MDGSGRFEGLVPNTAERGRQAMAGLRTGWGRRVIGLGCAVALLMAAGPASPVGAASPPTVSVGDVAAVEGNSGTPRSLKVPVSLSDPQGGPVIVSYTTAAGSATANADYKAKTSGTVKIATGKLVGAVSVKILPDTAVEGDETLTITLTAASGGVVVARATGTVTILDDDPTAGLRVGIGDLAVVEGDAGTPRTVKVPVSLSQAHTAQVTVSYTTSPGSATADADYKAKASGTVKIPAGKVLKTVSVKILPDLLSEVDETFTVTLTATSAGTLGRTIGTVTILGDEPPPANLWGWGDNAYGQLGNGSTTDSSTPVQVPPATWTQVDAGDSHTCGVRSDGTAWCWGWNPYGQLGNGTTTSTNAPVQVGTGTDWVQVSAGYTHSCGVRGDGTAWCWGNNFNGTLGDGTYSDSTTPVQVGTATDWVQVSAGFYHSCGRRVDGTAWCWGNNDYGQLGDGTTTSTNAPVQAGTATDWVQVSAGWVHTCGRRSGGTAWCWGNNSYGQLGDGTTGDKTVPTQVGTATDWSDVSAGWTHSCGVRSGTAWCWGSNALGQLGDGTYTWSTVPVQVGTAADWTQVSGGSFHTCGLRGGSAWCWGWNTDGQLGDGSTTSTNAPVAVAFAGTLTQVSAGTAHTAAVDVSLPT